MDTTRATSQPSGQQPILGVDGFYAVARLVILALLLAASRLLTSEPIWPLSLALSPISLLIWAYGIFAITVIVALILHQPALARVAVLIDLVFFSLLTYFNQTIHDIFYPLYIIPLVGAATQLRRNAGWLVGIGAALGYGIGFLLNAARISDGVPTSTLELLALVLRCAVMVCIPWLAGGLAERWSSSNRRSVEVAEEKRQLALDDANAYRNRMRALYEVAVTLSTNPQAILDTTLNEGRKLVPYSAGVVLLATGTDTLGVAAAHGQAQKDYQKEVTLGTGLISQALREPEAFVIEDLRVDPVFGPLTGLLTCRAACAVPFRSGNRSYGAMIVAGATADIFTEERVEMLSALANYALVALQNAQLIQDLRSERTKLLSKEEEVRHQLARDLHDGPAQALAAITMNAEFIKRLLERDPSRVLTELDKLGALAKRTTHEVRTMLFELRPLALETQGLGETLHQYFERFQSNTTKIILEAEDLHITLDTKTEGTLFNIIQEAVNNALKHARAEHIWVRVKHVGATVETVIKDDGRGFDLQKVKETYDKRGSFGLLNIEERAKLVNGSAEISSTPGNGTNVRVIVPVHE